MKKTMASPRTHRDAFAALVLGEIDTLLDKVEAVTGTIDEAGKKIQVTTDQLEGAGEKYNQAVLAANLRFKNETIAYLTTVTTTSIAKTLEEQQALVQELIRTAVSNEITTLKKVLSESHANYRPPLLIRWGGLLIAAFIGSAITIALIKY